MADKAKEFVHAIDNEDDETVKSLLKDSNLATWVNTHVSQTDDNGSDDDNDDEENEDDEQIDDYTTPLDRACGQRSLETVRTLVEAGADLYDVNFGGVTALLSAIPSTLDNMEKTEFLIDRDGELVNTCDRNNRSCLLLASQFNRIAIVEKLLSHGADVNDVEADRGLTSFHAATIEENVEIMKMLVDHGASVETAAYNFAMPIHEAASQGSLEALVIILDNGGDVNASGWANQTPLHYAAEEGHPEIIEELLRRGADINRQDKDGQSPLYLASENCRAQTVNVLLKHDKHFLTP